ncbi:MAG TPA: CBS domain-containing protein [Tepidisphaeraceae bacterium]|nr:CBS domain-containing protein [Tepidisphaeraceae bacterium]
MATVLDVILAKGDAIHSIGPAESVLDAVNKMNQFKIGCLMVIQGEQVVGIFTERDVLRRVIGEGRNVADVTVGEVMTSDVVCCPPETDLDDVSAIMKNRRVRHVPVCDDEGKLHGVVSIGDVNAFSASNQEQTIHFLNEYIYGRA